MVVVARGRKKRRAVRVMRPVRSREERIRGSRGVREAPEVAALVQEEMSWLRPSGNIRMVRVPLPERGSVGM